jgi:hypothetical protein
MSTRFSPWQSLRLLPAAIMFFVLTSDLAAACIPHLFESHPPVPKPFQLARPIWGYVAQQGAFYASPGAIALLVFALFTLGLSIQRRWFLIASVAAFSAAYVAGVDKPFVDFDFGCGRGSSEPLPAVGQYALVAFALYAFTEIYYNYRHSDPVLGIDAHRNLCGEGRGATAVVSLPVVHLDVGVFK